MINKYLSSVITCVFGFIIGILSDIGTTIYLETVTPPEEVQIKISEIRFGYTPINLENWDNPLTKTELKENLNSIASNYSIRLTEEFVERFNTLAKENITTSLLEPGRMEEKTFYAHLLTTAYFYAEAGAYIKVADSLVSFLESTNVGGEENWLKLLDKEMFINPSLPRLIDQMTLYFVRDEFHIDDLEPCNNGSLGNGEILYDVNNPNDNGEKYDMTLGFGKVKIPLSYQFQNKDKSKKLIKFLFDAIDRGCTNRLLSFFVQAKEKLSDERRRVRELVDHTNEFLENDAVPEVFEVSVTVFNTGRFGSIMLPKATLKIPSLKNSVISLKADDGDVRNNAIVIPSRDALVVKFGARLEQEFAKDFLDTIDQTNPKTSQVPGVSLDFKFVAPGGTTKIEVNSDNINNWSF